MLLNLSKPNTHVFFLQNRKENGLNIYKWEFEIICYSHPNLLTNNTITFYTSVLRKMRTIWYHRINRSMQFINYTARADVEAQTLFLTSSKWSGIKTKLISIFYFKTQPKIRMKYKEKTTFNSHICNEVKPRSVLTGMLHHDCTHGFLTIKSNLEA